MAQDVVLPYDPAWPEAFAQERARLREVLAPWLVDDVHHVGSTSVPGLAAKPVIDMVAGVRDLQEAEAAREPLRALGYHYRPHRPEAHLFDKPVPEPWQDQTHHLHLTVPGSALWQERLVFRDALRADPALREEYAAWKREHADAAPGAPTPYRARKTDLVSRVLAAHGVPLLPDAQRLVGENRQAPA